MNIVSIYDISHTWNDNIILKDGTCLVNYLDNQCIIHYIKE